MELFWIILIIFILFILAMIAIDSTRFVVRRYEIKSDKLMTDHHMVFVSDLHGKKYGKQNESLISAIKAENPEVILVGGDIFTAYPGRDFSVAVDFIRELKEKFPMVYAMGNHEYRAKIYPETYGSLYSDYVKEMEKLGVHILDNESQTVSEDVDVYGLTISHEYYKRFKHTPMDDGYLFSVLKKENPNKFSLLLAHNPDYFKKYARWEPDLILSGHLHGGVVRIPFWKGVISPMWQLFPHYDGGLFKEGKTTMIVGRGLGMHTIPLRLFNPAEIVVIDLKKE